MGLLSSLGLRLPTGEETLPLPRGGALPCPGSPGNGARWGSVYGDSPALPCHRGERWMDTLPQDTLTEIGALLTEPACVS